VIFLRKTLTHKTILGGIKKVNRLYPGSRGLKRPIEVFNLLINPKNGKRTLSKRGLHISRNTGKHSYNMMEILPKGPLTLQKHLPEIIL
jgi:hypothetical protein